MKKKKEDCTDTPIELASEVLGAINQKDEDINEKDRVGLRYTRLFAIVGLVIVIVVGYIMLKKKPTPQANIEVKTDQNSSGDNSSNDANQVLNF